MKRIFVLTSFFIFVSCAGLSDTIIDLGNGYFYYGEGYHSSYIFYKKKNGKGIEKSVVLPSIDYLDYDKDHVIVYQKPNYKAIIYSIISEQDFDPFYNEEERKLGEQKADSILKNDSYYRELFSRKVNYWIISKKDHQVYGPLSREEYLNKREELGVSEDLVLEEE